MDRSQTVKRAFITVREHAATGLFMATSDDVPGFVVHAHSTDELATKIKPAFESFMKAMGREVSDVAIAVDEAKGYRPPAFIAHMNEKAA